MVMKEKKPELVADIKEKLDRAQIVIATDYRGMTVANISELRAMLREQGVEYKVVKNNLASIAATQAGKVDISELITGPTAIAFGYDDVVEPAKILFKYQRASKDVTFSVKGALLGDKLLSLAEVMALSKLPSRDQLIAQILGLLQSPISGLLFVLNGNLQGLMTVLQGRVKQLEEGTQN